MNGYVYSRHYNFFILHGGSCCLRLLFFNKKRSSEEFTSAGRSLPGWVVGMSIFATYVSSISYLAYPGKAYMSDWNAFVFSLSIPIASYFAAKYFVPFIVLSEAYRLTAFWKNALASGRACMRHHVIF